MAKETIKVKEKAKKMDAILAFIAIYLVTAIVLAGLGALLGRDIPLAIVQLPLSLHLTSAVVASIGTYYCFEW